jgi:hypothetical protein
MSTKLVASLKQYHHDGRRWHFVFPKTPKRKGLCKVIYCSRRARVRIRKGRRIENCATCITCQTRIYRANHPARDAYFHIKDRARRRNQIFTITLDDLLAVPRIDEYLLLRGRGIDDLHLDRIQVHLGYAPGNLQVITAEENLRKQREVDYVEGPF